MNLDGKTVEEQVDQIYVMNKMVSPRKQWESFQKQSQYLDMLIKVNESGHKVHDEIDEAIKKLKEITYA